MAAKQMVPTLANWSSVIGLAVSIAGLVYSMRAFTEARKAKQSAEAARYAVRQFVAADRFQLLCSKAKELFANVTHENTQVAAFLAGDLRFEINGAITRWEFLDPATKERFKEASRLAKQVSEFMHLRALMGTQDKAKVLRKCDSILAILSGESGKIQSGLEARGEP